MRFVCPRPESGNSGIKSVSTEHDPFVRNSQIILNYLHNLVAPLHNLICVITYNIETIGSENWGVISMIVSEKSIIPC